MTDRAEILRELGLLPVWRLRARTPALGIQESLPHDATAVHDAPVAEDTTAVAIGEALLPTDERLRRIATLEWRDFARDVTACTACSLCRTRNKAVPGVGDVRAQWLFVGEAPGAEEDAKGEPFVGQAGRLLDNMLAALGMKRGENVYIANVLKCRPPGNRTPERDECETCSPFLMRLIGVIQPKVIVALGATAAKNLLSVNDSMVSMRGRLYDYSPPGVVDERGKPFQCQLAVTYHPAFLLRDPRQKKEAWRDLQMVMRYLDLSIPQRAPEGS